MLERLQKIEDKYLELEHELEQPETIANIKRTLEITMFSNFLDYPNSTLSILCKNI